MTVGSGSLRCSTTCRSKRKGRGPPGTWPRKQTRRGLTDLGREAQAGARAPGAAEQEPEGEELLGAFDHAGAGEDRIIDEVGANIPVVTRQVFLGDEAAAAVAPALGLHLQEPIEEEVLRHRQPQGRVGG